MKTVAQIFFLLAVVALGLDILSKDEVRGFRLRPLGEVWFSIDRESFLLLQPAIERHVHEDLWYLIVEPIVQTPAVPLFFGVGVALVVLSMLIRRRG